MTPADRDIGAVVERAPRVVKALDQMQPRGITSVRIDTEGGEPIVVLDDVKVLLPSSGTLTRCESARLASPPRNGRRSLAEGAQRRIVGRRLCRQQRMEIVDERSNTLAARTAAEVEARLGDLDRRLVALTETIQQPDDPVPFATWAGPTTIRCHIAQRQTSSTVCERGHIGLSFCPVPGGDIVAIQGDGAAPPASGLVPSPLGTRSQPGRAPRVVGAGGATASFGAVPRPQSTAHLRHRRFPPARATARSGSFRVGGRSGRACPPGGTTRRPRVCPAGAGAGVLGAREPVEEGPDSRPAPGRSRGLAARRVAGRIRPLGLWRLGQGRGLAR